MTDVVQLPQMSQVAKHYGGKLNKVFVTVPTMQAITDTVGDPNSSNVINAAGLPVPNAATTPTLIAGPGSLTPTTEYHYYVAFYDTNIVSVGNPKYYGTVTTTADGEDIKITFTPITNEDTNSRVTHFRIFRNIAGTTTDFYFVTDVLKSAVDYDDDNTDSAIAAGATLMDQDNNAPATSTYGLILSHRGFIFMAGAWNQMGGTDYDDAYTHSKLNNADQYPPLYQNFIARGRHGIIRGLETIGDDVVFYKDRAVAVLRFSTHPTENGRLKVIETTRGACNQRCIVNQEGIHFVLDELGIYVHTANGEINEISADLRAWWRRINWTKKSTICATYSRDRIWFFVPIDAQTLPHHAFVLDLLAMREGRGVRWWVDEYDIGIRDCARMWAGSTSAAGFYEMTGQTLPVVLSAFGYLFNLAGGFREGHHPQLTGESTVLSSGVSTVTGQVGDTFNLTNEDGSAVNPNGCYLRFPDLEGEYAGSHRINSVSGTTITVNTVWTVAPPVGATFHVGAMPDAEYRTPPLPIGPHHKRRIATQCHIQYQPRGLDFPLQVAFMKDRRAIHETHQHAQTNRQGISTTIGSAWVDANQGGAHPNEGRLGSVSIPVGGKSFQYIQAVLRVQGVDKPAVIDSIDFEVGNQA